MRPPASRSAQALALSAGRFSLASLLVVAVGATSSARAEDRSGDNAPEPSHGVVVVAPTSAVAADGPALYALAQAIYREQALRPSALDDARARALLGQSVAPASADSARFSELREGIRDDGAVSRSVLSTLASSTHAEAVAVVRPADTPEHVQIRLYLASTGAFDVSLYDGVATDAAWRAEVVRALVRRLDPTAASAAPAASTDTKPAPKKSDSAISSRAFYKSPWLWAALGGAVLLGGTALVVSHVTSNEDVRVRVEPPASSGVAPASFAFFRFGSVSP